MANTVPSTATLRGKVAIVTGASRGIGAGIAEEFGRRGANVVLTYTSLSSEEKVQGLVDKISTFNSNPSPNAIQVRADLRDPSSPRKIIEAAMSAFGSQIHILVNNAGINQARSVDEITLEDFDAMFNTNVRSLVLMTQATLPHFPLEDGRIINIGSTAARVGVANISLYTAAKAAVEALTRSWAAELGDRGITVNTVAPGSVESDLLTASAIAEDIAMEARRTPVERRLGLPNDIAQLVAWLATADSKWISGQCICASGGYRMY